LGGLELSSPGVFAKDIIDAVEHAETGCKDAVSSITYYAKQLNELYDNPSVFDHETIEAIRNEMILLRPELVQYSRRFTSENVTMLVKSIFERFQRIFELLKRNFPEDYDGIKKNLQKKQKSDKIVINNNILT
jgi:hypothetical protein